jgi:hypothetical protein
MIIDAMDILHSGHVGAFCLVTSDSDYTRWLRSLDPTFDHRTYGCPTLRALVSSVCGMIEVREEKKAPGHSVSSMKFNEDGVRLIL